MDSRIKELIDFTKVKFGLDRYNLHTHQLHRYVNIFNETIYTLSMEWFPNHVTVQADDDLNPDGTAVIETDIHSKRTESAIFVNGKSYANGMNVNDYDRAEIINWIEQETGLTYQTQFQLYKEEDRALYFQACVNGIVVSPSGSIQFKYDQDGNLTLFSVLGQFPTKEMVKEETYTLSLEKIKDLKKEQFQLVEFPSFEQERRLPIYAMEEIYIKNDGLSTLPFKVIEDVHSYTKIDRIIDWETSLNKEFVGEEIEWEEDVTIDQAFSHQQSPDSFAIAKEEQEKCLDAVKNFLRQAYPNDSGNWKLKTLQRENGYIHAILRMNNQMNAVFQRKLTVIIDAHHFHVLNYVDNKAMLDMLNELAAPRKAIIPKEEAYEKIKTLFKLEPFYVYDVERKLYVLCGKLDCYYGVNASNGEVIELDE